MKLYIIKLIIKTHLSWEEEFDQFEPNLYQHLCLRDYKTFLLHRERFWKLKIKTTHSI